MLVAWGVQVVYHYCRYLVVVKVETRSNRQMGVAQKGVSVYYVALAVAHVVHVAHTSADHRNCSMKPPSDAVSKERFFII